MTHIGGWIIELGILVPVLLLIRGLITGVNWLTARDSGAVEDMPGDRDRVVLEILRQRYARGEITKKVYDSMRERLGH